MEVVMETYVTLYKYTRSIEGGGSAERFNKVSQVVTEEKGKILYVYGLLGAYDILSVSEFPDNRAAMKAMGRVGNLINAQTHTMPAVNLGRK